MLYSAVVVIATRLPTDSQIYRFAGLTLDVGRRRVERDGVALSLQKKPLELLIYLMRHRDRAVSKDELFRVLWPDEIVGDTSLAMCVRKIRKAIGDDDARRIIETMHGYGYRFAGGADSATGNTMTGTDAFGVVGRESELGILRSAWRQVLDGERALVFVSGEAGIGKSATVQAFLEELGGAAQRPWILRGDCLPLHGESEPFLPLIDAWTHVCRGNEGPLAQEVLRRCAPSWLLQLHGVVTGEERERLQAEVRDIAPERVLRMLGSAFNEFAARRPVVLAIDDLHWADPSTLDVVARLARDNEPAPVLVLAAMRIDPFSSESSHLIGFVEALKRLPRTQEVRLDRLEEASLPLFLRNDGAESSWGPEVVSTLYARTRGHPLFLRAAVQHLRRGGDLNEVPPDLRRMIEHEIGGLGESELQLIEAGAMVGLEFPSALVATALDLPPDETEESLLELARRRRVLEVTGSVEWPDGTESRRLRFVHPYYAEIIQERPAKARQRVWHARIAARLMEAFAGDLPSRLAMRVARHFEGAGDAVAAVETYERVVQRARDELAYGRIRAAATAALRLMDRLPEGVEREQREVALRMALGPALLALDGYASPALLENCELGLARARSVDAVLPEVLALLILSAIHQVRGDVRAARVRAEELVRTVEARLPSSMWAIARGRLGQILLLSGELQRAREFLEAARSLPERDALRDTGIPLWVDPEVMRAGHLAVTLAMLGHLDQGRNLILATVERARALEHPFTLASAQLLSAYFHLYWRDENTFASAADEAAMIAEQHGFMATARHLTIMRDAAECTRTPSRAAVNRLRQSLEDIEGAGLWLATVPMRLLLAQQLGRLGAAVEGLSVLDAALDYIDRSGERAAEADAHRVRGELLASSDPDAAAASFTRAIEVARQQGARWFELRATVGLARLQRRSPRRAEVRAALAAIAGWFTEGADTADRREARALLDELDVPRRAQRPRTSTQA